MTAPRQLRTVSVTHTGASPTTAANPNTTPPPAAALLSLDDIRGWRARVVAPSGQTLSGSGDIVFWQRSQDGSLWDRVDAVLEFAVSISGVRSMVSSDVVVTVPSGHLYAQPVGVTFSGGADLVVDLEAWTF